MKKWYAVIGDPIEHSMSPFMHNLWMTSEGRDATYIPLHVSRESLRASFEGMKVLGCSGFNVTIPHKEAIIPLLDEVDALAEKMGAVNTVVRQADGKYKGYNTDGLGFVRSLEDVVGTSHKQEKVLVLGAGGASRGICFALWQEGYRDITIANRTVEKARAICLEMDPSVKACSLQQASDELGAYGIVIQTTSAGLNHSQFALPISLEHLANTAIVADIVYNPLMTPFLEQSQKQGATVVTGLGMFIHQGALAYEHWTTVYPDAKVVKQSLLEQLGGN
ncbi:shikimate dehydrogenase [Kurthia senegalensis]|uniref:shikimate dehydrogenase n=1 Tax=Kurthia senegalensis TaxID=1033740 RepID=UPI0004747C01|nr:shikimate dehydrogenase [Kurthia senegalensis]